jgi:hypothetical protein
MLALLVAEFTTLEHWRPSVTFMATFSRVFISVISFPRQKFSVNKSLLQNLPS